MRLTSGATILLLATAIGSASSTACSTPLGTGLTYYDHARYAEALEALSVAETSALAFHGRSRARYALYRGLTHLALGDREATLHWLSEAKRSADADPRLLSDDDAGRLASAWAHLSP